MFPHRHKGVPIKVAIMENGLIQREVAGKLGMPFSTFNMKVLGSRKFTEQEKEKLSAILDRPVCILFPDDPITGDTKGEQNTQDQLTAASA